MLRQAVLAVLVLFSLHAAFADKTAHDYVNAIPTFMGAAYPTGAAFHWKGNCFADNSLSISVNINKREVSATLVVKNPSGHTCMDSYVFSTLRTTHFDFYEIHGTHTFTISNLDDEELDIISAHGLRVFLFKNGVEGTFISLKNAIVSFFDVLHPNKKEMVTEKEEEQNALFYKHYLHYDFQKRTVSNPLALPVNASEFKTGDVIIVTRLDGTDSFLTAGTGGIGAHAVMLFWRNNQLWVMESGEGPSTVVAIQASKWEDWYAYRSQRKFNAVWLRLSDQVRATFNEDKAWAWFQQNNGHAYGFHNMLLMSVDTPEDSFPSWMGPETVHLIFHLVEYWKPDVAQLVLTEAINIRLNMTGLSVTQGVYAAWKKHNLTLGEVLAMPERNSYSYSTGQNMACSAFVTSLLVHGGIFGKLDVNWNEFTPRNLYELQIWDTVNPLPAQCTANDPTIPYCQLFGEYLLNFSDRFNKVKMYEHMNEHCPLVAPLFNRTPGC